MTSPEVRARRNKSRPPYVPREKGARLTAELAAELLSYDPESGELRWKATGKLAGSPNGHGYRAMRVNSWIYLVHRVIWLMMTGAWPECIDHIDLDGCNNRWPNLREATRLQNQANKLSKTGSVKGLKECPWGYSVRVRRTHVGTFKTVDEAAHAYNVEAIRQCGDFARLNPVGTCPRTGER